MRIGIGIGITGTALTLPDLTPIAPANLSLPVVSPESGFVGDDLSVTTGTWSGIPAPTYAFQWFVDGAEAVGETDASVTAVTAGSYSCRVTATNSEGTASETSVPVVIATVPAQAAMAIPDKTFSENTGNQFFNVAAYVTTNGNTLTYSLVSPPAGVTISGSVVTVNTDVSSAGSQAITVRATDTFSRQTDDTFNSLILALGSLSEILGMLPVGAANFDDASAWVSSPNYQIENGVLTYLNTTSAVNALSTALPSNLVTGRHYAVFTDVRRADEGGIRWLGTGASGSQQGTSIGNPSRVLSSFVANRDMSEFGVRGSPFDGDIATHQIYDITDEISSELDIHVFAGQSNMVGASSSTGFDTATEPLELRALSISGTGQTAFKFETDGSGSTINADLTAQDGIGLIRGGMIEPMTHSSGNSGGVSPATSIANVICDQSDNRPIFACMAHGATDLFDEWDHTGTQSGEHYDLMVANVDHVRGLNAANTVKTFFWCQGESSVPAGYAPQFKSMIDTLRAMWGDFLVIIMEHGGNPALAGHINMKAEQQKLATGSGDVSELSRCIYVERPAGAVLEADGSHFTGTTNRTRGIEAAQAAIAAGIEPPLLAPANITAPTITPSSVTVDDQTFTRVAGTYDGNPAPTVTWVWRKGTTQIPGTLNEATYTPDEPRSDYNVYETASNSQGSVNEGSANVSASLRTQATMALADQNLTRNTGVQNYDVSSDVTTNGNSLDYSLLSPPSGVTIVGPIIMVDTTVVPEGTVPITVRATDEYGRTTDDTYDTVMSAAIVTEDFAIQHFAPTVASGGGNQAITEIGSVDSAVIFINNAARVGAGTTQGTPASVAYPQESALALTLTSTSNVALGRASAAVLDNLGSFSVWEYIGEAGGPNEFIVRDRRPVTVTEAGFSYTPTGIVNADKCIPIITGSINNRPASSQWDHAMVATSINRVSGQVTVYGRGNQGNLVAEVTLVEFTGSNWNVHYATENADLADTGVLTLDGFVASWANAAIISQFSKNGGGDTNGNVSNVCPMYKPGSTLNQVTWEFDPDHTGQTGQRHTVYVLENPNMTVTRFQDDYTTAIGNAPAPDTSNVDITSAGLTTTAEALLFITTAASGTDSGHPRGQRNVSFIDQNTLRQYASRGSDDIKTEIQVIKLPNIGDPGGDGSGGGSPPPSGSSLPPVPEYPDSNFNVINLSAGANIQNTINGLSSLEGVKIKLAAGNYASFEIDWADHGNATLANPFVIEGPASGTARILDNSTGDSVLVAGVEHVILDRLFIEGAPTAARSALHVRLKNTGIYPRGFQLLRSTIARRTGDGIKFSEVYDTLVDTVFFSGELKNDQTGERHLDFNKFDNATIYRCTFDDHRAVNIKGGSRNAIIAECVFNQCELTMEIGEREGNGYWDVFDSIRNWAVIGTSIFDCVFNDCTGTHIKFKDVHDYTATNNRQVTNGVESVCTYQFLDGNQIGQSDYQNSNIVVDGVQVVAPI